ncbi:MAG TPA: FxsA family protein [Gammaproteobacteria bacterium]|nr:FxsA family protein [Gammaproteobacteria bacterium]
MTPFKALFLIFLGVPVLEIYLLITVGGWIGALPTVGLVVLTAVIGAYLLRQQGFATWQRVQTTLARGELPALEMMEGLVLLVSGALLLTPGFFTDTIGFLGLIPATRRAMVLYLLRHSNVIVSARSYTRHESHTIDGDYTRDDR